MKTYLNGGRLRVIAEHIEAESGRRSDRPALAQARAHRVPLVVAKVDRLTRSVAFLSPLLESGVEMRFCDLPQVEGPTGRFMLTQMAAEAESEAGLISARTKAAPAAAKARGAVLGGPGHTEPLRVFRRLQLLRGWSHDEANSPVFP